MDIVEHAERISEQILRTIKIYACDGLMADYKKGRKDVEIRTGIRHTLSGSMQEFYILDVMTSNKYVLAVFDENNIDNIKVDSFPENIKLFKIVSRVGLMKLPASFIRLQYQGMLIFNWQIKKYEYAVECNPDYYYLQNNIHRIGKHSTSGPAMVKYEPEYEEFMKKYLDIHAPAFKVDSVYSIRCKTWPPTAQYWSQRHRRFAWPTEEMVSQVVRGGCDVVPVTHRNFKSDPYQWRLSFSRAEIMLIRSWTPSQQVVYHMLRYFAKRELIKNVEKKEDEILCCYHLKTLMLWACELKSQDWWETHCVINISCHLLKTLGTWMANRYCPHYFLKDCNLIDYEMDEHILLDVLGKVHYFLKLEHLTTWSENEYIPMAQSTLSRRKQMIRSGLPVHSGAIIKHCFQQHRITWYNFFNRGISSNSMQLNDVDTLLMATDLLRLAWNVSLNKSITFSNPDMLNVLFTFAFSMKEHNVYHLFKRDIFTKISHPPLSHYIFDWISLKSKFLLKLVFRSNSIDYFLRVKIAKHFFKTCLKYNDESRAENVDATNVNLAALYYDSKEYKKAWKYCEDAIQNLDSKRNSQPLELDTFCFIEDIPNICAFYVLFNACIVKNGRPRQRMIEFAGLTLNFFARLLRVVLEQHLMKRCDVRSMRNMWKSVRNESEKCMAIMLLNRCKNDTKNPAVSSKDTTRQAVTNPRISKCYFEDIEFSSCDKLRELLAKLSMEYFSRFYNLNRDDASSRELSKTIVHYKALYYYRQKKTIRQNVGIV